MHGWREVEEAANVSKFTVNKKLKDLSEGGILKRHVIASFPPRTKYELNKEKLDPVVYEFLISIGKHVDKLEEFTKLLIGYYVAKSKDDKFGTEITEEVIQEFLRDFLKQLDEDVKAPLFQTTHESWHNLLATHRAFILMLSYWTVIEILTLNLRMKSLAEKILKTVSGSLTKRVNAVETTITNKKKPNDFEPG